MKQILTFVFILSAALVMGQNTTGTTPFVISEIMYNPPESGDDSLEYIEIRSLIDFDFNLNGCYFLKGVVDTFTSDDVVPANGYFVFVKNSKAFKNVFSSINVNVRQWKSDALKNGGEEITIANPNGVVLASVTYASGSGGWPKEADGNGASLELCDINANPNDVANWSYSRSNTGITINGKEVAGSPGSLNTAVCGVIVNPNTVTVTDYAFTPSEITIKEGETVTWDFKEGHHNVNGTISSFPSNPESFKSGEPAPAPYTYSFTFNIPGDYSYVCDPHSTIMKGKVHVIPNTPTVSYPVRTIGQVSSVDADGKADSLGILCEIKGVVYGVNMRASGISTTIIDSNRDGIGVFSSNETFGYTVTEGDQLTVRGKIDQFNGLTQIRVDTMWVNSQNIGLFNPKEVNAFDEQIESDLVKLSGMHLKNPDDWKKGTSFNATVTDGTNDYAIRVVNLTTLSELDAPVGIFDIIGIGGQFDSSSPYTEGYQLLPRSKEDLILKSSTKDLVSSKINVFPNPTKSQLFLSSKLNIQKIEIVDAIGKVVGVQTSGFNQINTHGLLPGCYWLKVASKEGIGVKNFIKE